MRRLLDCSHTEDTDNRCAWKRRACHKLRRLLQRTALSKRGRFAVCSLWWGWINWQTAQLAECVVGARCICMHCHREVYLVQYLVRYDVLYLLAWYRKWLYGGTVRLVRIYIYGSNKGTW